MPEGTAYGTSDFIHSAKFYDQINRFDDDLPFYRDACRASRGPVLELCCGTGRLTVPLARAGIEITGLDRSESMLARAQEKAACAGVEIEFVCGDVVELDLGRTFGLIFIPFNSLQCVYTLADVKRLFAAVKSHLIPGGHFIFDVFNPDVRFLVDRSEGYHEISRYRDADGEEVVVSENCHYAAAGQVNRATWHISRGEETRDERLDMRCFYPLEMDALVELGGFVCRDKFGSFERAPFGSESRKMIYVCEPADCR